MDESFNALRSQALLATYELENAIKFFCVLVLTVPNTVQSEPSSRAGAGQGGVVLPPASPKEVDKLQLVFTTLPLSHLCPPPPH